MTVKDLIERLHKFGMNDEVIVPASKPGATGKLTDYLGLLSIINEKDKRFICILPNEGDWSGKVWEFNDGE